MIDFPPWSDLSRVSQQTRSTWENEIAIRERYRRYFDGTVFKDTIPIETHMESEDAPLLFPVGLNLVKMICLAQADTELGEWDDNVVTFEVSSDDTVDKSATEAAKILGNIVTGSNFNSAMWEIALERRIFGGSVLKISPDLKSAGKVRWSHVPLMNFYPIWDPDEPNTLLEAYLLVDMTAEQAEIKYGISSPSAIIVKRVEHWTPTSYENMIDGVRIDAYSGVNPWGVVPFVYIPHMRTTHWWGDALTEDLIPVQDELNMRIADLGEAINYSSHPIKYGFNLPKEFNARNFPVGPAAMWNLGRVIGNSPEPKVGLLEANNPIPSGTFEYINFVYDWSRVSSFSPPVAFGEDGGGQKSGATLEVRMLPLIRSVRRARSYTIEGLQRAIYISGLILKQKNISGISSRAVDAMIEGRIKPKMAEILPKDHQATVDEVVKLFSTNPPSISLETSQKILGRGVGEVDRIMEMISNDEIMETRNPTAGNDVQEAQAGKMTPQTSNN